MKKGESKTLILIDGHALAFRSFFALERTGMQTTEHTPTWAVFGFFKAIFDLLKNQKIQPEAIAVAFDVSKKTFRLEKYEAYKANRQTMPDSLRPQMELIMEGLKAFNIPIYTKEGFEGDDIIGTIATEAKKLGHKTLILTGDKDSFQLIDKEGEVSVLIPSKGQLAQYNWDMVYENMGVYPNQVIDYKALCGDTSDNIPGIRGIGPKSATELLREYGTLENVYKHAEDIPKNSVREKIINGKEEALLSQFLATIKLDVDIDFDFTKTCLDPPKKDEVAAFLTKVQFYSFVKNIDSLLRPFNYCPEEESIVSFKEDEAPPLPLEVQHPKEETNEALVQLGLFSQGHIKSKVDANEISSEKFHTLISDGSLISLYNAADGVYAAFENNVALLNGNDELFSNSKIKKAVYDYKSELSKLPSLNGVVFDAMLASYVKDSSRKHDIVSQIQSCLNIVFQADPAPKDIAVCLLKLYEYYDASLNECEKNILKEIEIPLARVLRDVEDTGVYLDTAYLKELGDYINGEILKYEKKIHTAAGMEFNISSPKQVQTVLFDKMQIKPTKKIKTGFSTNAKVLEELAQEYEIARDILEHRQLVKLKTTYIDTLPKLIGKDGRVHTHYNQTVTTTGRLSSSDPNLQNIPIRTELGSRIRSAFIAQDREHSVLLSADYSQIELRFLAHCSQDEALIYAFSSGEDIHTLTASKVYDVPLEKVTKSMRAAAKAVNFGLIYGQTRFGLSSALGITPFEAQNFIDKYFQTYPKIRGYMSKVLMQAHQEGYVETILGRRRYLKEELYSRNARIREFAERAAINAPLQGSSADLIKIAMVNLYKKLEEGKFKSKIILQVHDELVLEVPENELLEVKKLVCREMECAQKLSVPLQVDVEAGKTWKEDEEN